MIHGLLGRGEGRARSTRSNNCTPDTRATVYLRAKGIFNESIDGVVFGSVSLVYRLDLSNGRVIRQDVDLSDLGIQQVQGHGVSATTAEEGKNALSVFILKHSRAVFQLSQQAFVRLLETCLAPAHYLDVLLDNNGALSSYVTHESDERLLQDYYVLAKLPFGPYANGSIMFRHSFKDNCTDCILSVDGALTFCDRFTELDSTKCRTLDMKFCTVRKFPQDSRDGSAQMPAEVINLEPLCLGT